MKENKEKPPQNPNILIAPNLPRIQKDSIQLPPSPKPGFHGAPSTDAPPTPGPDPRSQVAQPGTQEVRPTPVPASCARTLKRARKAPGRLSLRVCACVQAQWVFLCVSVCTCICACGFHCTEASSSLFTGTGDWEGTERPLPLFLSNAKPQSPTSWCHQAQTGPAIRAVGEGRGRPPLLPLSPALGGRTPAAAPQSCAGRKDPRCCPSLLCWEEAWDLHPQAGVVEGEGSQEAVPMAGKTAMGSFH